MWSKCGGLDTPWATRVSVHAKSRALTRTLKGSVCSREISGMQGPHLLSIAPTGWPTRERAARRVVHHEPRALVSRFHRKFTLMAFAVRPYRRTSGLLRFISSPITALFAVRYRDAIRDYFGFAEWIESNSTERDSLSSRGRGLLRGCFKSSDRIFPASVLMLD